MEGARAKVANKQKKSLRAAVVAEMKRLDALQYADGADYDAIERAKRELATAGRLRKRTHRKKSLAQLIEEREQREAMAEAKKRKAEEQRKLKNAAAAKRRAQEKAERERAAKAAAKKPAKKGQS